MKKLKTRNEWIGCNRKCRFFGDKIEAYSYDHWCFVKKINGKVIFNDYNYSQTTRKHQWEIKSLLKKLGIKIDIIVYISKSLTKTSFEEYSLYYFYDKAINLIVKNNTKRIRSQTKLENIKEIEKIKKLIKECKKIGANFCIKKILSIYKYHKRTRDNKEYFLKNLKNKIIIDTEGKRFIVIELFSNYRVRLKCINNGAKYVANINNLKKEYKICKLSTLLCA